MKGPIRRKGKWYTVGGEKVQVKRFVSRSMFKWWNFIHQWAVDGSQNALKQAEEIMVERYLECGVAVGRTWYDFEFWKGEEGKDFWDTPTNYKGIINLKAVPDEGFKLSEIEKKVLKKGMKLAIKHGFYFNHTFAATIKHYEGRMGDPRRSQEWTNMWLGHYFVKLGTYLKELREELGYLPAIFEFVNEYQTVSPQLTFAQISNMCQRFHVRGPTGEVVGMDCGGPIFADKAPRPYPKFSSQGGAWEPDDVRYHPPRDVEIPWWEMPKYTDFVDKRPVYIDEPILLMPKEAYDNLPPGHWWRYGGTKSKKHYGDMLEGHWEKGHYTCIHDGGSDSGSRHGGGVSAGWVPGFADVPGEVDEWIKDLLGVGPAPPPPPPPPPDPEPGFWEKLIEWLKKLFGGL